MNSEGGSGGNPHGYTGTPGDMERVTVRVPRAMLSDVEALVERGTYPNRSEAIRRAMAELDGVEDRAVPSRRVVADGGSDD